MTTFLDLPPELVERILSHLSAITIFSCILTCKTLQNVVGSSPQLQLILETHIAGVNDNAYSDLSVAERLQRLREREKNWNNFTFAREKIPTERNCNASTFYVTEAGHLFVGDELWLHTPSQVTTTIDIVQLTNSSEKKVWNRVDIGKKMLGVGLALEEHDLLAVVAM